MAQYFTAQGLKKLKEELHHLKTVGTRDIAALLKYAASFGDLKENAGYHDAKDRQAELVRKIRDLEAVVNDALVYEKKEIDKVQVCSSVLLLFDGKEEEYQIVAPVESDILKKKLSYLSPLGQKLLGQKIGKEFDFGPAGEKVKVKILKIN